MLRHLTLTETFVDKDFGLSGVFHGCGFSGSAEVEYTSFHILLPQFEGCILYSRFEIILLFHQRN